MSAEDAQKQATSPSFWQIPYSFARRSADSPVVQTVAVQFFNLGLGMLNSLLLARQLGPTGRGELAAALLWPQALVYIGCLGIQEACVYFAARSHVRTGVVFTNAFILFLFQAPVLVLLGFALIPSLLDGQIVTVVATSRLLLITTGLGLFSLYGTSLLRGKLRMRAYNALQLIIPVGSLLGTLGLILTGHLAVPEIALVYIALYAVLALATLLALLGSRLWDVVRGSRRVLQEMMTYGAKVHLGSISQIANLRLDQMLMAAFLPPAQLGLYVVAVSVTNLANVLPFGVRLVVTSRIAQADPTSEDKAALQKNLRLYWTLNVVSGVLLLVLAPPAIALLFGPQYIPAIVPAEILIVGSVCLGGKEILTGPAYGLGTPTLVSHGELLSLAVTVVALALLLPAWGILGAAVASLLAYALAFSFLVVRMRAIHGISPRAVLLLGPRDVAVLQQLSRQLTAKRPRPT